MTLPLPDIWSYNQSILLYHVDLKNLEIFFERADKSSLFLDEMMSYHNHMRFFICLCWVSVTGFQCFATERSAALLCQKHIERVESELEIPQGLLSAIAIVETGKKPKGKQDLVSWPWVLNVEGKPKFYSSKTDALMALRGFLKEGIRNIDVGCMQINYRHHGHKFSSPLYMLDPRRNVLYAGNFLKSLKKRYSSWTKGVGYYHSGTLKYQVPYRSKVYKMWQKIRLRQKLDRREQEKQSQIDLPKLMKEHKVTQIKPENPWIAIKKPQEEKTPIMQKPLGTNQHVSYRGRSVKSPQPTQGKKNYTPIEQSSKASRHPNHKVFHKPTHLFVSK